MTVSRRSVGSAVLLGALAGLMGGLAMMFVMLLLRTLAGIPTTAELLGDRIAPLIPVDTFLALLGFFGGYNQFKQLGIGAALAGQLGLAVAGGIALAILSRREARAGVGKPLWAIGRRTIATVAALSVVAWLVLVAALFPNLDTHYFGLRPAVATILTSLSLAVLLATYAAVTAGTFRLLNPAARPSDHESDVSVVINPGRRRLLIGGAGAVFAASSGGMLVRLYDRATFSYDGMQYIGPNLEPITPNERFYVVTKNVVDPRVNRSLWALEVNGHVDRPQTYDFGRIEAMSPTEQETTLMCISNPIAWGLISNAVWTGVPMRALLEEAGAREDAVEVVLHGADGYTDTFSFDKAMDPTTLVAYRMNGEPLPQRHGFPARIIVPGLYGEKNVKWVTRIEVVDREAKGFYETQGWGPDFTVPNRSRIDGPSLRDPIRVGTATVLNGMAFAGDRGVGAVEVSTDGQRTWEAATITYPGTSLTWSFWEYPWQPDRGGEHEIAVRTIDGQGNLQTSDERGTAPQGATGLHVVTATVVA
ncbi:MAG: molybdopterin-dependent oxidoreductase [Chloroflexota bacterium]|nr:molybdopterin-dependent oxidoreductase [Chloroflexota bacterium]